MDSCYKLITEDELKKIEFSKFVDSFCFEPRTGERIYHNDSIAEKVYLEIQLSEMKRYAQWAIQLGKVKSEDAAAIMWVKEFAAQYSNLWKLYHPCIEKNKPRKTKVEKFLRNLRERALEYLVESEELPITACDFV